MTRDIGGAIERYEQHKFDKMNYVISSQQDLHTAQFIKVLHLMEFPWLSSIEHAQRDSRFPRADHSRGVKCDARADEEERGQCWICNLSTVCGSRRSGTDDSRLAFRGSKSRIWPPIGTRRILSPRISLLNALCGFRIDKHNFNWTG